MSTYGGVLHQVCSTREKSERLRGYASISISHIPQCQAGHANNIISKYFRPNEGRSGCFKTQGKCQIKCYSFTALMLDSEGKNNPKSISIWFQAI